MQGLDADPSNNDLIEKRTEAEKELSSEQIDAVMTHLYGVGRNAFTVNGHVSASSAPQPTFVVDVSLTFPQVGACKVQALERLGTSIESSIFIYRQSYSACCQRTILHANPQHKFCMSEPIRASKISSCSWGKCRESSERHHCKYTFLSCSKCIGAACAGFRYKLQL